MIVWASEIRPPPPGPETAARIRTSIEEASAQVTDPTMKMPMPKKRNAAPAADVAEAAIERCHRRGAQQAGARYPRAGARGRGARARSSAWRWRRSSGRERPEDGEHDPDHDRADGGVVSGVAGCAGRCPASPVQEGMPTAVPWETGAAPSQQQVKKGVPHRAFPPCRPTSSCDGRTKCPY